MCRSPSIRGGGSNDTLTIEGWTCCYREASSLPLRCSHRVGFLFPQMTDCLVRHDSYLYRPDPDFPTSDFDGLVTLHPFRTDLHRSQRQNHPGTSTAFTLHHGVANPPSDLESQSDITKALVRQSTVENGPPPCPHIRTTGVHNLTTAALPIPPPPTSFVQAIQRPEPTPLLPQHRLTVSSTPPYPPPHLIPFSRSSPVRANPPG